jgi:hypothetical protein
MQTFWLKDYIKILGRVFDENGQYVNDGSQTAVTIVQ